MQSQLISSSGPLAVAPIILLFASPSFCQAQYSVANLLALESLDVPPNVVVTREGYKIAGDGGYAQYLSSSGTCDTSDTGYQVSTLSSLTCYTAIVPSGGLPIAVWGVARSPITLPNANSLSLSGAVTAAHVHGIPLWCGPGDYDIRGHVSVPSGIELNAAPGTCTFVVDPKTPSDAGIGQIFNIAGSHVHITGVGFSGNIAEVPSDSISTQLTATLVGVGGATSTVGGDDIVLDNDRFENSIGAAVIFNASVRPITRSGVRNSVFHNIGMYWRVAGPAAAIASHDQTATSLTVTSTLPLTGLQHGMSAIDTTTATAIPEGTIIGTVTSTTVGTVSTFSITLSASGAAKTGDTIVFGPPFSLSASMPQVGSVISFAALPSDLTVGMAAYDETNPIALPPNTMVSSVSGSSVTLSNSAGSAAAGDDILFASPFSLPTIGTQSGTTLTIDPGYTTQNLSVGMSVYDLTNPTAIIATPPPTIILPSITSISGNTVVISVSGTASSSDKILFGEFIGQSNHAISFAGGATVSNRGNFLYGNSFDQVGGDAADVEVQSVFIFEDNICDLSQAGWQPAADGTYGIACVWTYTASHAILLANNIIDGATSQCVPIGYTGAASSNIEVSGNVIRNCGGSAVPPGYLTGGLVEGNVMPDNYQSENYLFKNTVNKGAVSILCGSSLSPMCTMTLNSFLVGPNVITDDQSAATMPYCLWEEKGGYTNISLINVSFDPDISCSNAVTAAYGDGLAVKSSTGTVDPTTNPFAFRVQSVSSSSTGTLTLPVAPTSWNCQATDLTTQSSAVFSTKQTSSTATAVPVSNFSTSGAPSPWTSGDTLGITCAAY